MGFFFKNKGQEETPLKKWVVVFFHLFLPVLLGVWGLLLSIAANRNREQIDALTKVVTELKDQSGRLQRLVTIQDSQLKAYQDETKYNKRPFLKAILNAGNLGDVSDVFIKITNSGGDALNVKITSLNGAKIDSNTLPKSRTITSGAEHILHIENAKSGKIARLIYTDILMNKFSQELFWQVENENISFSAMKGIVN